LTPPTDSAQRFRPDIGHPALSQHLHAVMALMRASRSWNQFKILLDDAFPRRDETTDFDFVKDIRRAQMEASEKKARQLNTPPPVSHA
jgi:hypothetical protein